MTSNCLPCAHHYPCGLWTLMHGRVMAELVMLLVFRWLYVKEGGGGRVGMEGFVVFDT